ncbi:hypothetical protein L7F22_065501 [Adiantum nelumboides]|nr:hypothetical protein [Adiantum nelumboides]
MALRFLARDGSRRLTPRARDLGPPARPWSSFYRSKHTLPQENIPSGLPTSAHNASLLVKGAFAEAYSGVGARATAFADFSQTHRNPHRTNSTVIIFPFRRCEFREACQVKPPLLIGPCRGIGSFTTGALSQGCWHPKGNAAVVLPHKVLFRGISMDAITKKMKLSPSNVKQPIDELMKTASRYKDAAGLQVEAFWKRNVMILVGVAGVLACFLLWQIMYGVANLFVSFSEGMAKFGFLAMAAATVAFAVSSTDFPLTIALTLELDIAHAVGVVSWFMANPGRLHWDAVKSNMRYLKGTKNKCLCYGKGPLELKGFCDSDMAGDVDTRKSTSDYVFTLAGGAVSWCSRLQKIVALSTTEAEYISATEASKEAIWLARLCSEFGLPDKAPMFGCDSQSAICLAKNAMFHARTRHIDVRYHFIREVLEDGFITLVKAMALRARYTINPDKVYRIAMRMMNTSAAALEVLGPPLTGTDLRAYVMSSGGLKLKKLKPRIGSRRCFLIFPIQGSERKGVVSAEVKKKKGKYDFKLLAIDVAVPGAEQRVFLVGDETEYKVGGGLIGQLRDPMFKAMAAQEEFDAQDEKEEEEEAKAEEARREQEAKDEEARRNEEIERLEKKTANK